MKSLPVSRPATPIPEPQNRPRRRRFFNGAPEPIDAIFQIRVENCTRAHRPLPREEGSWYGRAFSQSGLKWSKKCPHHPDLFSIAENPNSGSTADFVSAMM
jgi:hypothetical protein